MTMNIAAPVSRNPRLGVRPGLGFSRLGDRGQGIFYRMFLVNLVGLALVGAAWGEGWVQQVFASDSTGLTYVIAAGFVAGLVVSLRLGWRIAAEQAALAGGRGARTRWGADFLNRVAGRDAGSRGIAGATLRGEMAARLAPVRQISGSLVILGLIGTVLGFILALSGISASMAGDVGAVSSMITRLIAGMSVALFTTLEGAVLSLWLTINHQMLTAGASRLVSGLVKAGEDHVCA